MKKLNLLLVMLASFSLVSLSSCEGTDEPVNPTDIMLSVSGGTGVELKGEDIAKDITVTASSEATKDIVVTIKSDAAEGEAVIAPAEVTIKKGEKSVTSKITFAAAKFPKGTAEKKITVSVTTTTEGVSADGATTVFNVKGEAGPEMPTLTITASGTDFNTTTAEAIVTFTFTLSAAHATEFPVGVTFGEGTSEAIKTMFASLTTVKFAANATAPVVVPVTVPKGTEGKLIANFAVEDKTIDLKTTTLSATFTVDKPEVTIKANGTEFNTTAAAQTLTITPEITEALADDLVIAITYTGSDEELAAKFAAITSVTIPKTKTAADPINFEVAKGGEGKLVVNFTIANTGVRLMTAKLEATFNVVISSLCAGPRNRGNYYMCKQFTVGDYTSEVHEETAAFTDLVATVTAKVKEGDMITLIGKNKDSGPADLYKAYAWVDWNNDGLLDDATERVMFEDLVAGENGLETTATKAFAAPAGTAKGRYAMRVGTGFSTNMNETAGVGGCAAYETVDFTDILINYTPATK